MSELKLVKAEHFGNIPADIYARDDEMYMTITQLANCLEYSSKARVERIIERNPYLRDDEFSFVEKVPLALGGTQKTRMFTEDGIFEITMISKQPKAREFRQWVRKILKSLRRGELMLTNGQATAAPALTKAQIESFFENLGERLPDMIEPMLNDKLNYMSTWLMAALDKRIDILRQPVKTVSLDDSYMADLLRGQPDGMPWREWVYKLINYHLLTVGRNESKRQVLSKLYEYLRKNYGFVPEDSRKKYKEEHNTSGYIATITLVENSNKWRDVFSAALLEYVHSGGKSLGTPGETPVIKQETEVPDESKEPPRESIPEEPKRPKWRCRRDEIADIVRPFAESRADRSKGYCKTLHLVYSSMGVDWPIWVARYMNKRKLTKAPNKIDMVANEPSLRKAFEKAVKMLETQPVSR